MVIMCAGAASDFVGSVQIPYSDFQALSERNVVFLALYCCGPATHEASDGQGAVGDEAQTGSICMAEMDVTF